MSMNRSYTLEDMREAYAGGNFNQHNVNAESFDKWIESYHQRLDANALEYYKNEVKKIKSIADRNKRTLAYVQLESNDIYPHNEYYALGVIENDEFIRFYDYVENNGKTDIKFIMEDGDDEVDNSDQYVPSKFSTATEYEFEYNTERNKLPAKEILEYAGYVEAP